MKIEKHLLDEQEKKALLEKGEYGILSLILTDNQPYGVPINYYYDEEKGELQFHTGLKGEKRLGLKEGAKASFTIVGENALCPEKLTATFESLIIRGVIHIVEDKDEKTEVLLHLIQKLAKGTSKEMSREAIERSVDHTLIFSLRVQEMSGKRRG